MSQENVEIVRRWLDAYNRRDFEGVIGLTDRDCEFQSRFVAIESAFRGNEGVYAYFRTLDDAYEHFQLVMSEFIDAEAAVLAAGRAEWRGKASGAQADTRLLIAFWLRAAKVLRTESFTDRAEALKAVGLAE
jgi:ketosteroid isomerase-like protein